MFLDLSNLSRFKKNLILILLDLNIAIISFFSAFFLRLEYFFINDLFNQLLSLSISLIIFLILVKILKLYNPLNRFFSTSNFIIFLKFFLIYSFLIFIIFIILQIPGIPRTVGIIFPIIFFLIIILSRICINFIIKLNLSFQNDYPKAIFYGKINITSALYHIFDEYKIVAFVTSESNFEKNTVEGIDIYSLQNLNRIKNKNQISTIILVNEQNIENIIMQIEKVFFNSKLVFKIIPDAKNILEYKEKKDIEGFKLEGRVIEWNKEKVESFYFESSILITGGGGSIGSELAIEFSRLNISKLFILENTEYNLYKVLEEINLLKREKKLKLQIFPLLGSVQDINYLENIIKNYKPDFVFHCAAYKHVGLVQQNVIESIKNNFFSTLNICELCIKFEIKNFILISSDKAVNPINIMGCTKRLAELAVQYYANKNNIKTKFLSVRFANVLNSSGSVIPLFARQIKNGGPVTVTHKDVTRYFMKIIDAVKLVIQSIIVGKNGEILLLKMGKPIKIYDLAVKLINYFGYTVKDDKNPKGDIRIIFTGLKEGEKIEEDLSYNSISNITSNNDIISVDRIDYDAKKFEKLIADLKTMVKLNQTKEIENFFKNKKLFK